MRRISKKTATAMLLLICLAGCGSDDRTGAAELNDSKREAQVTVFAAASTTDALDEIGELFTKNNQIEVKGSYASSSTLAKQIEQGAPADIYLSANPEWMDYLEEKGKIAPGSRFDLLGNSLVLIAHRSSALEVEISPGFDIAGILEENKLSIGDPEHVPAGIYGKQALEALGVWRAVEPKLARAWDVRAAMALVERNEAPLGIVYATDAAISKDVKVIATFPGDSHPAITYPAAVVAGRASEAAALFLEFLKGDEASEIFEKRGFSTRPERQPN